MLRVVLALVLFGPHPAPLADEATVRVRLLDRERPVEITVIAQAAPAALLVDGRVVQHVDAGIATVVTRSGSGVSMRVGGQALHGAEFTIRPSDGIVRLRSARTDRSYRGNLEIRAEGRGLEIVNVVELEDYVASVIPSEYPFPEIEGVKAQAVLVRTYALRSRGRFGNYDLVDHVGSQVYNGVSSETELARRAAEITRGEVLTYAGELAEAVYFSSSGGHTADNESVWDGAPRPYLRGRPDPYDAASPLHRWTETVDRDRVLRALSRSYGFQVTGIAIAGTSPEGRVTRVRLLGSRERVEQANRFRLTLNDALGRQVLKSTFFTLARQDNRYVFSGRGFGHGVGMSQYGAREKAIRGRTYEEILTFYFNGVSLERRSTPDRPPALLADRPIERMEPRPARPISTEGSRRRTTRTGW